MNCEWNARYNAMPGADHDVLRVTGECEVDSSSVELELEETNEGFVDQPELIALRLKAHRPDFGDTMIATKTVQWERPVTGIERVRITGEADATIPVQQIQ